MTDASAVSGKHLEGHVRELEDNMWPERFPTTELNYKHAG